MAEPFKNLFNETVIRAMAGLFDRIDGFDRSRFLDVALSGLDDLELMQRSDQIAQAMTESLPGDYPDILGPLTDLLHPDVETGFSSEELGPDGLRGWALMPVGKFVATHGLAYPSESLDFLREMTMRSSSEFAVRPFYRDHPDLTLARTADWARDPNFYVRRLASEGSRPRLPWGLRLHRFVADPTPLLPILKTLRDDSSEYVRRSVANNLNDIAKDHPDLVARLARDWMQDASANRRKLVKHACRTLIKSGHPQALEVFGFGPPDGLNVKLSVSPKILHLGETLTVSLEMSLEAERPLSVLVDLIARFRKAGGQLGAKVFKWTETTLQPGQTLRLQKALPLRDVTTRRHYPGPQGLAVQINGVTLAETEFELLV